MRYGPTWSEVCTGVYVCERGEDTTVVKIRPATPRAARAAPWDV